MTIRDILVHIDTAVGCEARLNAAIAMAVTHDAHLVGLYVMPDIRLPAYSEVDIPADILQAQEERQAETAAESGVSFDAATSAAAVSAEWRCVTGDPATTLAIHARYMDLVVVSQHAVDGQLGAVISEIPDHIVLTAGRPVLVIPDHFTGGAIGKRVMIGWDAGQMATRALHDALPILQKAEQVSVMVVNPKKGRIGHNDLPGADVAHHLARHGVVAEADHITAADMGVGDQLLARSADMRADLVVTGAYGHARWKELILGGVTRQLLETMPVPVLMSH